MLGRLSMERATKKKPTRRVGHPAHLMMSGNKSLVISQAQAIRFLHIPFETCFHKVTTHTLEPLSLEFSERHKVNAKLANIVISCVFLLTMASCTLWHYCRTVELPLSSPGTNNELQVSVTLNDSVVYATGTGDSTVGRQTAQPDEDLIRSSSNMTELKSLWPTVSIEVYNQSEKKLYVPSANYGVSLASVGNQMPIVMDIGRVENGKRVRFYPSECDNTDSTVSITHTPLVGRYFPMEGFLVPVAAGDRKVLSSAIDIRPCDEYPLRPGRYFVVLHYRNQFLIGCRENTWLGNIVCDTLWFQVASHWKSGDKS